MPGDGAPSRLCERTGVAIPECSCPRCVEDLLARFQPPPAPGSRDGSSPRGGAEDTGSGPEQLAA